MLCYVMLRDLGAVQRTCGIIAKGAVAQDSEHKKIVHTQPLRSARDRGNRPTTPIIIGPQVPLPVTEARAEVTHGDDAPEPAGADDADTADGYPDDDL